jgi:hypothetical protein
VRYLLLIYEEPSGTPADEDALGAMLAEYGAVTGWLQDQQWLRAAAALQDVDTATTVSVQDGTRVITDGPFAETKEHLAGYYVVDVADLDAAIAWAAKIPSALHSAIEAASRIPGARTGKIEIRPIWETG